MSSSLVRREPIHKWQTVIYGWCDVGICQFCPNFQGYVSFGPLLGGIGYLDRYIFSVLSLEIRPKSNAEKFNWSLLQAFHDVIEWYGPTSPSAEL